jgi:hypothetical protein
MLGAKKWDFTGWASSLGGCLDTSGHSGSIIPLACGSRTRVWDWGRQTCMSIVHTTETTSQSQHISINAVKPHTLLVFVLNITDILFLQVKNIPNDGCTIVHYSHAVGTDPNSLYIYRILTTVDLWMTQILTVLWMQPGQHGFGPNYIVDVP